MHLLFVSNDTYIPHVATTLASIFENNKDIEFVVHILVTDISGKNNAKLKDFVERYGHTLDVKVVNPNDLDIDLSCRHFKQYNTTDNLPSFSLPGYYDWIVMNNHSEEIINKGRFIVLPSGTKQHHFYEVFFLFLCIITRFLVILNICNE